MPASVLLGTGSLLAPSASTDPKASLDPRTAASPSALLSLCQPALVPVTSSRQPARAARLCTLWPPDTPYVWLAGCIKGHLCSLRDSTPSLGVTQAGFLEPREHPASSSWLWPCLVPSFYGVLGALGL